MSETLSAESIIVHLADRIELGWVAGEQDPATPLHEVDVSDHATLIGHLNLIRKNIIQVIGRTELDYLNNIEDKLRFGILLQLFCGDTVAVIVADDLAPPAELTEYANKHNVALLKTPTGSNDVVDAARYYLDDLFTEKKVIHGVFMEVFGAGTLITGESSVGKSELALELITRGHRLIADDAPEFTRLAPDVLEGRSPSLLKDFMEVRGLGILNIRDMYGDNALKANKYLRLIVRLQRLNARERGELDRLEGHLRDVNILGIEIPETLIPVAPGRNTAVLVEAAVRNHILRSSGHDATEQLVELQRQAISDSH